MKMSHLGCTMKPKGVVSLRKVILTMKEEYEYQQIKRYVDQSGNFKALCIRLDCSERTARRKVAGYRKEGRGFFRHKNHDKKPASTISREKKEEIIELYNKLYFDANFTHFKFLLQRNHPTLKDISLSSIRNIMKENDILSPLAWKKTKKNLKLKEKTENIKMPSIDLKIEKPSISIDPHPRREKSKYAGELIFLDASIHPWFAGTNTALHAAIDDASGIILAARFEEQETLKGYYQVFAQILKNYGIPHKFSTDGRTVFDYKRKGLTSLAMDTSTQFGYACKSLGVDIRSTTSAQAQGKVERLFGTLQSRLFVELRLQNVTTIEQANDFLLSYIPIHNKEFAARLNSIPSAFENQLSDEEINLALAVISSRIVDKGNCISYQNSYYRFLDEDGNHVYLAPKQKVLVISALDGRLFASCKEEVFALEALPKHKRISYDLDLEEKNTKPSKAYIPSFMHPWKINNFEDFAYEHRSKKYSFDELIYSNQNIFLEQYLYL